MFKNKLLTYILILITTALFQFSCSHKKVVKYIKRPMPRRAGLAIIIDTPNRIKNVILSRFLKKGFNVKAIAASDMYSTKDVYDIKDLKKVAYKSSGNMSLVSMEKTFNNIYKLHLYNFEINKAEMLDEIKRKWNVQYLVLLNLKDWEKISWGRAIDLNTYEIVWLENYPTQYKDTVVTVVDHFIQSMTKMK